MSGSAQFQGALSAGCPLQFLGNGGCSSAKCFLGLLCEGDVSPCPLMSMAVGDGGQLCLRVSYPRKVPLTSVFFVGLA